MTYPAHRCNLHGIMYLPWNRGVTPSKKIGPLLFPSVTSRPETAREAWHKTGYYHPKPWAKNHQ